MYYFIKIMTFPFDYGRMFGSQGHHAQSSPSLVQMFLEPNLELSTSQTVVCRALCLNCTTILGSVLFSNIYRKSRLQLAAVTCVTSSGSVPGLQCCSDISEDDTVFPHSHLARSCKRSKNTKYLCAVGCFRLQVVKCDKLPEQTALLVASLHPTEFKIGLWLEEDESQVDGKASHVDGKRPVGVEHRLPAVDLPSCVDLGGLVPQASHKGHRPH